MRTIKFRGKRIDTGEWVYGSLDLTGDSATIAWNKIDGDGDKVPWFANVDPSTVGQFTGLQDINGTEIYEGDILEGGRYSFICKWIDSGFALIYQGYRYGPEEKNNWLNRYPLCQKNVEDLNIVGNIFDNPELVK